MKNIMKKVFSITLLVIITFCFYIFSVDETYAYTNISNSQETITNNLNNSEEVINYASYKEKFSKTFPDDEVKIDVFENISYEGALFDEEPYVDFFTDDNGIEKEGLYIPETGNITFNFNVANSGYYNLQATYYNVEGRSATITRTLKINGEIPFKESRNISFTRYWKDSFNVEDRREDDKDDLKPSQNEVHLWSDYVIRDTQGYYNENYYFYFEKGENTITFDSNREPIVLNELLLLQSGSIKTYEEYLHEHEQNNITKAKDVQMKQQAEVSHLKSSP